MKKLLAFRTRKHDSEALSALVDGRLSATAATTLEAHLAICAACRTELAGLRSVRAALQAMPQAAPRRSFRLRVADIEGARPRPIGPFARALPLASAAAFASFVALAGIAVLANNGAANSGHAPTALTGQHTKDDSYSGAISARDAQEAPVAAGPSGLAAPDNADKSIDATPAATASSAGIPEAATSGEGAPTPPGSEASTGNIAPVAPTAVTYSDSAAPRGSGDDNGDVWWYAAAAAGFAALLTGTAALYARRRREGI